MSGRLDPMTATMSQGSSAGGQSGAISQLKRFGRAKAKINSIYEEILGYGCDVANFLHSFTDKEETRDDQEKLHVVPEDCAGRAELINKQLDAISGVLKRDHMKVSFFKKKSRQIEAFISYKGQNLRRFDEFFQLFLGCIFRSDK